MPIFLSVLAVFLGSFFYLIEPYRFLAMPLFAAGLIGLSVVCFFQVGRSRMAGLGPAPELLVILGFGAFALLSSVTNGSLEMAAGAIFIVALYFASIGVAKIGAWRQITLKAFLASGAVMIVWSLLTSLPVPGGSYAGIFYNSGVLGSTVAIIAAVALGMALREDGSTRYALLSFAFICLVLVAFSRSRGAILALGLCGMVAITAWAPTALRSSRTRIELAFVAAAAPILAWTLWPTIVAPIIDKMLYKAEVFGDVTDGRLAVWQWYLSESTLTGGGRSLIAPNGLGPHNSFLSVIVQYGWASGLCFAALIGAFIWRSWSNRREVGYVPLMSCICFVGLSGFEGMMLKPAMFAAFLFGSWALVSPIEVAKRPALAAMSARSSGLSARSPQPRPRRQ